MSLTEPTIDSAVLSTMKTLIENQTLAVHQTLQQYMSTVDSRFEDLRSQINGSVGASVGSSRPMAPEPASSTVLSGVSDISPLLRSMKMDVPKFDGTDPTGWDFRINEFFDFHGTPDHLRLHIVSFHMEGKAAAWYQWMKANNLLSTWQNFLLNLKQRFGTSMYEDHQGNLSKLSQTSTVTDFQSAFEDLMNKVTGISEPLLVSFFITGLKPDIRRELLFARPTSLMEAFALAKAYEARSEEIKTSSRSWTKWTPSSTHTHQSTVTASPHPASYKTPTTTPLPSLSATKQPPQPPLLPTPTLPIRRLTPAELREKREKGLCYNCDQKYSATHRCRSKFLLLMGMDDEDDEPSEDAFSHAQPDEVVTADISSLNALAGQTNPRSLRVLGTVASYQFQVLIDSGSTHNFLKPPLAERLSLSVQAITHFRVYIGNVDFLTCRFLCPKVPINMQGHEFLLDFFLLPIEGPDAVLGIQWLQSLGRISTDYSEMTMEFQWEGKSVILRGDPIPIPNLISFNQFHAMLCSLKENLRQAQHRMAPKANLHRRETQLQVGDKVLVHLQPYRQTSVAKRSSHKLARRYYGPFTVVERIGPVAYKLELPTNCKIHPVSHISLLKPYVGNSPIDVYSLPPGSVGNKPLSSPIAVCAEQKILRQGKEIPQILVQWSDSSPENSTWEDFEEFRKLYPALHLEDKVSFQGMGNDTTWPIVMNQIEHNETAKEETQPAEMEEVQPLNETPAREQLKTGGHVLSDNRFCHPLCTKTFVSVRLSLLDSKRRQVPLLIRPFLSRANKRYSVYSSDQLRSDYMNVEASSALLVNLEAVPPRLDDEVDNQGHVMSLTMRVSGQNLKCIKTGS
ncbi:hypothetical protein KPL71_027145 [Citrus sinensis]|uniref:Uncharacterized protein n=1 Tax=Citrus sinensis TaxID=2711 RepID=A0ACB8I4D9_CITSI|nr:hypothetical protein KPL71_027145 [Citrus sinensis]